MTNYRSEEDFEALEQEVKILKANQHQNLNEELFGYLRMFNLSQNQIMYTENNAGSIVYHKILGITEYCQNPNEPSNSRPVYISTQRQIEMVGPNSELTFKDNIDYPQAHWSPDAIRVFFNKLQDTQIKENQ